MKFKLLLLVFVFVSATLFAQKKEYSVQLIADSLKENADAVVRLHQIDITLASQRSMTIKTQRVVTVLNESGLKKLDASENYDKKTTVKSIQATLYDGAGVEIKKIKRKDFRDQAVIDGITVFSDNRVIYLDYTPTQYPFTLLYESEVETSNTAFLPLWIPINDYFLSIERGVLNVKFPENLGFKKKEFHFSGFPIMKKTDEATQVSYEITNCKAQKPEDYSPDFGAIYPKLMMGLENFNLEGVDGNAKTWETFGQWYYDKILTGTTELPEETKAKIKVLVGTEKDPIKKAKLIYNYVQQKSRYISIQVGIGGWKPMLANDVDRLGYGDCKALTNYTKALLDVVGVPSYSTVLYGGSKKNIESEFVSMQGNHMILAIPSEGHYTWLECTSQEDPFGYQGTFTDDREVLVVKPNGGEIVRTTIYNDKDNTQISKGNYAISEQGELTGQISIVSQGTQYARKARLEKIIPTEQEAHYKEYWDNINNLKINKLTFSNDKERVQFTENVAISAINYGVITANKMMFVVNSYNQTSGNVKRIRNRKTPFEIARGFLDKDEIVITLPKGYAIEFLPSNFELNTKFGEYKTEILKKDAENIVYKRTFFMKKGMYSSQEYDDYRAFREQISKNDNAKIIITKS